MSTAPSSAAVLACRLPKRQVYLLYESNLSTNQKAISMKERLAVVALALFSAAAYAESNEFEGFNVGVGVGYVQPKVTYTDSIGGRYQWNKGDLVPQVDAAYNKAINDKWLIGIGLTLDLNNTDAGSKSEAYGPVETTLKEHASVYIQPTYVLDSSSAVFAKVGYYSIKVEAVKQAGANWIDDRFRTRGIGYGIGYKRFIDQDFFVQAEIQIVDYENKSWTDSFGFNWEYQQQTTAGIFTVGYKF